MGDMLFVSCTRGRKEDTELFRSLASLEPRFDTLFFENNTQGLSARYNWVLDNVAKPDGLVIFAHDDLRVSDSSLVAKITDAAADHDIIGLVGADAFLVDPSCQYVSWMNAGPGHWSGQIRYCGADESERVDNFGPAPQRCVVIDGLLMAVRPHNLKGVRFDEQFAFHFYDLDFCLSAVEADLRISTTAPTEVLHRSHGNLTTQPYKEARSAFLAKWGGQGYAVAP